tara:strand:+ start:257 stop:520 length:264 start_codon:yes stop_codon:yes gene_type:complete
MKNGRKIKSKLPPKIMTTSLTIHTSSTKEKRGRALGVLELIWGYLRLVSKKVLKSEKYVKIKSVCLYYNQKQIDDDVITIFNDIIIN